MKVYFYIFLLQNYFIDSTFYIISIDVTINGITSLRTLLRNSFTKYLQKAETIYYSILPQKKSNDGKFKIVSADKIIYDSALLMAKDGKRIF